MRILSHLVSTSVLLVAVGCGSHSGSSGDKGDAAYFGTERPAQKLPGKKGEAPVTKGERPSVTQQAPTQQAPTQQAPTQQAPVVSQKAPFAQQAPTQQEPIVSQQAPTQQEPLVAQQAPTQQVPTQQVPIQQAPVEQQPYVGQQAPTQQGEPLVGQQPTQQQGEESLVPGEQGQQSIDQFRTDIERRIDNLDQAIADYRARAAKAGEPKDALDKFVGDLTKELKGLREQVRNLKSMSGDELASSRESIRASVERIQKMVDEARQRLSH